MTGADPAPPARVRVVLADGRSRRGRVRTRARQELEEQTGVGDALVRGLVRAQLALALRLSAVVGIGIGLLPLLFALVPGVTDVRVLGIALPWLLLGVLAYPFLLVIGWIHMRVAERNERDFAELVERS
jgi:fatty acid desaturase